MEERFVRNVRGIILGQKFNQIKWTIETNSTVPNDICYFKVVATYEGELIAEACVRMIKIMPKTGTDNIHEWEKRGIVDWLYVPEVFERIGLESRILEEIEAVARLYQLKYLLLSRTKEELNLKQQYDILMDEKVLFKKGYKIYRITNEDTAFLKKLKY